jgi:PAS domain S-box-containing protein
MDVTLLAAVLDGHDGRDTFASLEDFLKNVLETLPVGVWLTNDQGRIVYGNPAGRKIWGGARYVSIPEYAEYKGWWPETGERIAAEEWALARALRTGQQFVDEVIDIEAFDGIRKTIINSAVPLKNSVGKVVGAMVVNEDISAIKRMEAQRERLRRELDAASDEVKKLTGLLPICASCKNIRDYEGCWHQLEVYIRDHSAAEFTHTLCPRCAQRFSS